MPYVRGTERDHVNLSCWQIWIAYTTSVVGIAWQNSGDLYSWARRRISRKCSLISTQTMPNGI